ncbi:adenosine kinase [Candidatus Symbiobacter mobilis]|uniref:Sugar kinase n=1 Tax=Candidatus Symbiobacter mobilis CR TaxID=946483 RepID=U5NDE1_9BURK|nr:adenosine kinase [Candidatus Symbiobacter mobilis]AGX88194.1 sugar kinase [Candidatus Symbiobacter mobilis CR]
MHRDCAAHDSHVDHVDHANHTNHGNRYDLYAIGNALVDAEYEVSEEQLRDAGVGKGQMALIDANRLAQLQALLQGVAGHCAGGGSAANTVVAFTQLGGRSFYSCCVADDDLGDFYLNDLRAHGVDGNLARAPQGQTGNCLVLITPDAERSMSTFLGVSAQIDRNALHPEALARSGIYYMEGYLASSPSALDAVLAGRALAREHGVDLALTLSDVSMIRYCREGLDAMVGNADTGALRYLFCNEAEARAWCDGEDLSAACTRLARCAQTVCITRAAQGCIVVEGDRRTEVPAPKVRAIDTNGAGDMFAGVFLYAVTHGRNTTQAAALANACATRVVAQYGTRLQRETLLAVCADVERSLSV